MEFIVIYIKVNGRLLQTTFKLLLFHVYHTIYNDYLLRSQCA